MAKQVARTVDLEPIDRLEEKIGLLVGMAAPVRGARIVLTDNMSVRADMAVPSATPRDIVEQLNGLINEALTAPEVRRRMDEFGLSWDITDLAACDAEVRAERERWTEYTRVAGIQPG